MLKNILFCTAFVLVVGFLFSDVSAQIRVKNKELKNLAGNFVGELEYLDYKNDTSKTVLKLRSINTITGSKVSQAIIYIEPNGKEVKSASAFTISADGTKLSEEKMTWTIIGNRFDKKSKTRTIVYEIKWTDNERPADLRETLVIGENEFTVTKEVRYENTENFFVRNTHRYRRQ